MKGGFSVSENHHAYFERQLSPNDTIESLKDFVKHACSELFEVEEKKKGLIKYFFNQIFAIEMEKRGYSVK